MFVCVLAWFQNADRYVSLHLFEWVPDVSVKGKNAWMVLFPCDSDHKARQVGLTPAHVWLCPVSTLWSLKIVYMFASTKWPQRSQVSGCIVMQSKGHGWSRLLVRTIAYMYVMRTESPSSYARIRYLRRIDLFSRHADIRTMKDTTLRLVI